MLILEKSEQRYSRGGYQLYSEHNIPNNGMLPTASSKNSKPTVDISIYWVSFKNFVKNGMWNCLHQTNSIIREMVWRSELFKWWRTDNKLGSPNEQLFGRITRSLWPTSESNLNSEVIIGVPEEWHRLRPKVTVYSNRHSEKPIEYKVKDKGRLKVTHRHWKGAAIV